PDSGNLFWLGIQIGFSRALELEMTGRPITAEQAQTWGLVSRVVDGEQLAAETAAFVRPLVKGPSQAFGLTKQMFNRALFARSLESLLDEEAMLQELAGRTQDHQEG